MGTSKNDLFKGVCIGIPRAGRAVPMEWAFSYKQMDTPINYHGININTENMKVDEARNFIALEARKHNCRYLFFLGDDTVPPPHVLRRFVFMMENKPEIKVIGGIYCTKSDPAFPLVFRGNGLGTYWDWKAGELFWVTGLGMDCTMIRMSVFDEIAEPWFLTIKADGSIDNVNAVEAWTEDLYFCKKITDKYDCPLDCTENHEHKHSIYADGSILCDHWDVQNMKKYSLPMNSKPATRYFNVGDKKILDLGCGTRQEVFPDGIATRVDQREEVNPDYRCDLRMLPFETETWDVVYSSHVLEHFSRREILPVLDEWLRVLRVGGELRLVVPDVEWAAQTILDGKPNQSTWDVLYGQGDIGDYDFNYHRCGFTLQTLQRLIENKGLRVEKIWKQEPYNLCVLATKLLPFGQLGEGEGRALVDARPATKSDSDVGIPQAIAPVEEAVEAK